MEQIIVAPIAVVNQKTGMRDAARPRYR
jgi:hypothetical protein